MRVRLRAAGVDLGLVVARFRGRTQKPGRSAAECSLPGGPFTEMNFQPEKENIDE
jgi:hypothetical protein